MYHAHISDEIDHINAADSRFFFFAATNIKFFLFLKISIVRRVSLSPFMLRHLILKLT